MTSMLRIKMPEQADCFAAQSGVLDSVFTASVSFKVPDTFDLF